MKQTAPMMMVDPDTLVVHMLAQNGDGYIVAVSPAYLTVEDAEYAIGVVAESYDYAKACSDENRRAENARRNMDGLA